MGRWKMVSYDAREMGCVEDPEARLAELGRAAGPLRRVAAALAGRMVARRGWERLGYASIGDYARERLGVSASSLTQWARVDARLEGLPGLGAALVSGALPWSKVRLLARFVSASDEARWIERARLVSVRRLEREVRAVDRGALETGGLDLDECGRVREKCAWVRISGSPGLGLAWQRLRRDAEKVAGQSLDSAAVLEMVTAETLSALPLDGQAVAQLDEAVPLPHLEEDGGEEPGRCVEPGSAELPAFLRSLVSGLSKASAFELDERLRRVMRLEQRLDASIGPLLRQVASAGYEWRGAYKTLAVYAREQLGMSPRKARALLRLERAADGCPELKQAYRDGALSWLRAQILTPLLTGDHGPEREWRPPWVAIAERVTVRRLGELVEAALALQEHAPEEWVRVCDRPEALLDPAHDEPERQVCAKPMDPDSCSSLGVYAPVAVARLFRATLCTLRRAEERQTGSLPSEGDAFEAMIAHALQAWGINESWLVQRMRRVSPVFERDGWRCTVPGCSSRRNLQAHHIVFRSAGGGDEPENLTTLCAVHHQRGVHAGRVTVRGRAPDALVFELGLRCGLPPLERYRSGDRVA